MSDETPRDEKRGSETTNWGSLSREELWFLLDANKGQVSPEAMEWARSVIASGEIDRASRGPFKSMRQWRAERAGR